MKGTVAAAGVIAFEGCMLAEGELKSADSTISRKARGMKIPAYYYEHFNADFSRERPEEGFGGWKKEEFEFSKDGTALVVMHTWQAGTPETYPGWWRCAPWLKRANVITEKVMPGLLASVRKSGLNLFHVAGGSNGYWKKYPGYKRTLSICKTAPSLCEQMPSDSFKDKLCRFKSEKSFVGTANMRDVARGFQEMDFPAQTRPLDSEPIADSTEQLFALCKEHHVNHLVYSGFAINWCLQYSPGGMVEISKHGIMCSAIRQATTAVENKESAASEMGKELALWRVALEYGFVFDVDDFTSALS
jgi:hypothetical protein